MLIDIGEIIREMGDALSRGEGAYFVGSGISAGSGLPDWVGLRWTPLSRPKIGNLSLLFCQALVAPTSR